MSVQKQILLIGAGIGGLSVAIHLALQGHAVHIVERQPQVGGKLNHIALDGFSFDTGPSLVTMPYVLRELFATAGRSIEEYLDLQSLDITCRYFYRDGALLNAWRDHDKLAQEFARFNPEDGAAFWRFLKHARTIFDASANPFLYHSRGGPLDLFQTFLRYIQQGGGDVSTQLRKSTLPERLGAIATALSSESLDQHIRTFFTDEHIRQLFARYATYNGSSPYQLGAVYSIIPYVELADGGWYPRGGMYTIAQALERLACELGVCIETNQNVRRILVEHGRARGVVLADGRVLRSDLVVANSDVVTTYRELLSPAVRKRRLVRRLEHLEPSSSGFVMMLGTNKQYPALAHHNIFFSDDYPAEFEDLFVRKLPQRNPTIYINATTRSDPGQAPDGHENLFILVNTPALTEQSNWQRDALPYRDHLLDRLASYQQIDLRDIRAHIVAETLLTPLDFQRNYGANAGSIYGLSSNARMAPFTRPGNRAPDIAGLYFVGGSTHPGGGVPLVMLSGKIVAGLIAEDYA
ncbi:phytoene desaturase family protein [Dictyobacter arantiisoli]|uniref:4,4'-diaponeurosporene oxygenase n=1 Tax=Dictyobacter arantiisoli TaxID=2014874 RepID=A0A5A5TJ48_9CHLR|nr:phytoene desaturase family protein [Dictyobacter arantiisoli]GCF11146.1 phytoene desaturase [Dictyobacter arantiisoli]